MKKKIIEQKFVSKNLFWSNESKNLIQLLDNNIKII